jgi:nucleotide-binding universal stress UspA family protein
VAVPIRPSQQLRYAGSLPRLWRWVVREVWLDAIIRVGTLTSNEEDEMSIFPTRILLAADGSAQAELATGTAVDLARMSGSELHVVHVLDAAPSPALLYPEATDPEGAEVSDQVLEKDLARRAEQLGRQILDTETERVVSAGGTVVGSHLAMGDAPREIVHLAEDLDAGLVVMGSRGRGGIRRALMGSVSDAVVRHAHCPVLVVRA